ncbi:MAG: quinolinate synthase NadA [Deltaproteobacteria bacterium]|nr:quinolinate synthase NadA [Deltaproteobacteria bacterium]
MSTSTGTSSGAFPSIVIRGTELQARGAYAEAQADFLHPDPSSVKALGDLLERHKVGVVAHFYMDPELQGVLTACDWPHIHISDSLMMADAGISMVEAGMKQVVVLGVDFMSENVRALLDAAGHEQTPVYRVATDPIGCSLAESAQAPAYGAFLEQAAASGRALHVVYINTSLVTKARAHHLVPTITCTSSNVVKTVLQAFAQIPDLSVWYGPDTYMGNNLRVLFKGLSDVDDSVIAALHPAHNRQTIEAARDRFHHFQQGVCIVHHLFGREVVEQVKEHYADVFITAHLEVPGEMFELALAAQRRGAGAIGSTANILGFISDKVAERAAAGEQGRLRFILGTEAGMITSIVRRVQDLLREHDNTGLEAEIIFPVASEAIAQTDDLELGIVPGAAGGEGCTTAGGCATCPYMKMNSLDSLMDLLARIGDEAPAELSAYHPRQYVEQIAGRTAADLGGEPILHMRHFQQTGELPQALVAQIAAATR